MGRHQIQREDAMTSIKALRLSVIALIWVIVVAIGAPLTLWMAPDYEAQFFPVLGNQSTSDPHLSADRKHFLWTWNFDKLKRGKLDRIGFMMYSDRNDKYIVRVYRGWDCKEDFATWKVTPAGERRALKLCADIPPALQGKESLTVIGHADYTTFHRLWLVPVMLPSARVGPYRDPDEVEQP